MKTSNFDMIFSSAKQFYNKRKMVKALEALEYSVQIAENNSQRGKALELLGIIYKNSKDNEKALNFYLSSLDSFKQEEDKFSLLSILNKIALLYGKNGDIENAIKYFEECLQLIQEIQDVDKEVVILKNLGKLYTQQKDFVKSLRCHQRSLELKRLKGDILGEARKLKHMGFTYESSGNFELARDYYEQALELYSKANHKPGIDRINDVLDELESIDDEMEEEEYLAKRFSLNYDYEDFI